MMDFRENLQKCREYIQALEEERAKIQVFQRELPLCFDLVTQAIETCKQQLSGTSTTDCLNGHSECSEQTTSNKPVLEEFIPLKRSNSTHDDHDEDDDDDDDELESNKEDNYDTNNNISDNDKSGKKSDWLRSVQLWNQTPDPPTTQQEDQPKRVSVMEVKKNCTDAFHPFQKEKNSSSNVKKPTSAPEASVCSSGGGGIGGGCGDGSGDGGCSGGGSGGKKEDKGGQSQRKSRRCWSPELHKRFLHALQQLGGSHVATPKQIRELMKVDGLTNDEVKSHLQKYRLHTRRPSSANHNTTNNRQAPQFVVVGGIWMPSPEYTTVATTATTTSGDTNTNTGGMSSPNNSMICKPVASMATTVVTQRQQQKNCSQSHCEERGSHISTSSSTHTSTASHAF